jgi:S-DNA-T family DNA segregation ATPase FtsK/SpoIIIE
MPLKTPSSSSKSDGKSKGRIVTPARGKGNGKPASKKKSHHPEPEVVSVPWWDTLSAERKLDVVGAIMAVAGVLIVLILFSAQRSAPTEKLMLVMGQFFGWGIYVLPAGLIVMGLWLVLRRIEKLPPLSLERATGIILFFFWLQVFMHSFYVPPEFAEAAALEGKGGGYIGSLLERILFNSLGAAGAWVILLSWLLITITMIFDISVQDLFKWVSPMTAKIREMLAKQRRRTSRSFSPEGAEVASNGYTPLNRPEPVVANVAPGTPVTTVKAPEAVINWQLPEVKIFSIRNRLRSMMSSFNSARD